MSQPYISGALGAGIGRIFFYFQVPLFLLPKLASAVVFIDFIYHLIVF